MNRKIEAMLYTIIILQVMSDFPHDPGLAGVFIVMIAVFFEVFYPWLYGKKKTNVTTKAAQPPRYTE